MMAKRAGWLMAALATIAAIVSLSAWYQTRLRIREDWLEELAAIVALLKEDREGQHAMQAGPAKGDNIGTLAWYLAAIRSDGVAKHADAKQKLDRLAENNAAILALINVYEPHARSMAFKAEAQHFRRYAIAWRDRWNSVMELFMAGGSYPVAEVPFPIAFLDAVQVEINSTQ